MLNCFIIVVTGTTARAGPRIVIDRRFRCLDRIFTNTSRNTVRINMLGRLELLLRSQVQSLRVFCTTQHVMNVVIQTGRLRISRRGHQLLRDRAILPTVAYVPRKSDLPGRFYAVSRRCYIHRSASACKIREETDAPPHDGRCGHPLSPPLGLVILELVCLVDDLFRNDLLDDICTSDHSSSQKPSLAFKTAYLQGL